MKLSWSVKEMMQILLLKDDREDIRRILAHGPHENDPKIIRNLFYQNLSIQTEQAFLSYSVIMVVILMQS